eukprot:CAMPEP_0201487336 /NCGR_PEP_ID=MMETSP0151_2-20130828/12366_1 /ASSEMBLY_ACC=CAM_ASM_000257 /TAXON_ID=200890 /ORGANISM="Paramoeba atlantica, Strain 621/1 / CCAP 1560/9" /LENGTH=304 /DNA_ID=CAMNT_0047872339 /DNA_START=333 /DNA_END=1247 /DNA_ORIENTATION=+
MAKQMRILYDSGFTDADRLTYKKFISLNVILSMRSLLMGMKETGIKIDSEYAEVLDLLTSHSALLEQSITKEIGEGVKKLWADQEIKTFFKEKHTLFQIMDTADYFFDHLNRLMEEDYLPTDDDILHCRTRTSGISEFVFSVENAQFKLIDVGGQRSERRKWIHCFQNVTAIIFFVALSEYDQSLYEDHTANRMQESIMLFAETCNCQWFREVTLILFLNKCDLFREKIKKTDLKVCFPDYEGGRNYDAAVDFITKKFVALHQHPDKKIYVHVTCATDTQMTSKVFDAVRETLRNATMTDEFNL